MIPVQTKEHLIYFMQTGMMRLSKYDLRFVQNLQTISLQKNNLTTNQVALFDKLVDKYRRQLHKHGITSEILEGLTWESTIVPSDPKFTEAYVTINDHTITFRSPFSKKFVDAFHKVPYNSFKWYKEKKVYEAPYSTHALRVILQSAAEHYPVVNYCPVTSELLNSTVQYNAKYWSPTLIKLDNHYLIAATNRFVDEAIKDLPLSSDIECLVNLSTHGVAVDSSVTNGDPLLEFASTYEVNIDFAEVDTLVTYLKAMNCDAVLVTGQASMLVQYRRILKSKLADSGIHVDEKNNIVLEARLKDYSRPVLINLSSMAVQESSKFKKVIRMKNSLPVVVR